MTHDVMREIASNVTIISLALLAVAFILMSLSWKGFEDKFRSMRRDERRELLKSSLLPLLLVLLFTGIFTLIGIYSPKTFQISTILVMLGFIVIIILYLVAAGIRKLYFILRKKRQPTVVKLDEATLIYFISLTYLTISVFYSIFAMIGSIPVAMEIDVIPNQANNFNESRWFLLDSILFFVCGTLATGVSFLMHRTQEWKKNDDSDKK